jgi:hypothetical protein
LGYQFVLQLRRNPNEMRGLKNGFFAATPHQNRPVRNKRRMILLMRMSHLCVTHILKRHHSGKKAVDM